MIGHRAVLLGCRRYSCKRVTLQDFDSSRRTVGTATNNWIAGELDLKPLIAGNWKMNGLRTSLAEIGTLAEAAPELSRDIDLLVCPPATLLHAAVGIAGGSGLQVGGQDCHAKPSGAHTGDVSAEMLSDLGARFVIVGHSERRSDHAETNEMVADKADAVLRAGLIPIICIGESHVERESGATLDVLFAQLEGSISSTARSQDIVLAYEPIWAIGRGVAATDQQIADVHGKLRGKLKELCGANGSNVPILYGGSMKPENADAILAIDDVNGGLIGGASLLASSFLQIARSALRVSGGLGQLS